MAIKGFEHLNMTEKEISDLFPDFNCSKCKGTIDEEGYTINKKPVCSECYEQSIDRYNIDLPRMHHGRS